MTMDVMSNAGKKIINPVILKQMSNDRFSKFSFLTGKICDEIQNRTVELFSAITR